MFVLLCEVLERLSFLLLLLSKHQLSLLKASAKKNTNSLSFFAAFLIDMQTARKEVLSMGKLDNRLIFENS